VSRLALLCVAAVTVLCVPAVALGALGITASSRVSKTVTLDGLDQTATFTTTLTVKGGNPQGWSIDAWAPRPSSGSDSLSALYVASEPSASCSGHGCKDPRPNGLNWPITLGTSSGDAVTIYNADRGSGTGTDTMSVPFSVDIDADTLAGDYTTTITVAVSMGP
jgi:hypothetical protein